MARSIQQTFGRRVRELRVASGMTQEELSERCGLFRTYMSRIETGRANPTLAMIDALATSLRVPLTTLFETGQAALEPAAVRSGGSRGRVRRS